MKVSFSSLDLKSKIENYKQKRDEKIMKNLQTNWDRKKCNVGLFGLSAALIDFIATPLITKQIVSKNIKANSFSTSASLGFGILGFGLLIGYIFNKIDEKKNTKLGNFAYIFFNGPNSLKNNSKIDTNL